LNKINEKIIKKREKYKRKGLELNEKKNNSSIDYNALEILN
jgi:hypothetical protein